MNWGSNVYFLVRFYSDGKTKTISITDEVYSILKSRKETTDSLSEVIVKLASFFGTLSKESADALEKSINDTHVIPKERHKKRLK